MKTKLQLRLWVVCLLALAIEVPQNASAASAQILGWNNLGMHCMDSDYSVFSILPPYNTIEANLIVGGKLVTNGTGYSVTYQAVADPDGSFNSTAMGKGNYYTFATALYGATLAPEGGLAGWSMPGPANTPQGMFFEPTNHPAPGAAAKVNWFRAEGIPISPFDDGHRKNPYPLMRLIARNGGGTPIATNDIVLPVSDEMDCRACHASGAQAVAKPVAGWAWSDNPERDYRLNIVRLHDENQFADHAGLYAAALAARGFNPQGLYRGVVADGKPVLCAICHASEALGTGSYSNIPPLTASVHSKHASVRDPYLHITLDNSAHRAACYRCHPGSATKCLRGAMGGAIALDGSMEMQCQSCHGSMSQVGSPNRVGWFMEPTCQSCHTGTATSNNGRIRYTTSFETNGSVRVATNQTFATKSNTPAAGLSLYRFSAGHGGLQCSACHGSTHAEFPATHRNDNLRNQAIQGHAGVMVECTACHTAMSASATTVGAGPHGMHPLGQTMVDNHPDLLEGGTVTRAQCQACHGVTYRGTELARAQNARTVTSKFGTKTYFRGQQVTCYDCHNGANSSDPSANTPPVVAGISTNTTSGQPVDMSLPASDANGNVLALRVISQTAHGSVGLSNLVATYFPDTGFVGNDSFTFTANDGTSDGNLATGTVAVAQGTFGITAVARVPSTVPQDWPAPFGVTPSPSNVTATASVDWNFGDGSSQSASPFTNHAYSVAGTYHWTVICSVQAGATQASVTNTGTIVVTAPQTVEAGVVSGELVFAWPKFAGDSILEWTSELGPAAVWNVDTNRPVIGPNNIGVVVGNPGGVRFYRLRKL